MLRSEGWRPGRLVPLNSLLGATNEPQRENGYVFDIYSLHDGGDAKYQFPGTLKNRVVGSLPYSQRLSVYKDYKNFLNVNLVTQSPTMCARRRFELIACGTPVVTTRSQAIDNHFAPNEVFSIDPKEKVKPLIKALLMSPAISDRVLHRAQRKIWPEHTYRDRAELILGKAAIYFYLEGADALSLRWPQKELTWYHFVADATLFCKSQVLKSLKIGELSKTKTVIC